MGISYDISYVLSEMTTSVKFYLSYDPLKFDFIAFKMNIISLRKRMTDTDVVNDVTNDAPKCYYTCGHTIFMT